VSPSRRGVASRAPLLVAAGLVLSSWNADAPYPPAGPRVVGLLDPAARAERVFRDWLARERRRLLGAAAVTGTLPPAPPPSGSLSPPAADHRLRPSLMVARVAPPLDPPAATIPRLATRVLPQPPPHRRAGTVVRAGPATADGTAVPAVAPAAGPPLPTPRRDPLGLPLTEEDRWEEWLLAVTVNGETVSEGAYVIREPGTGRFAVRVEDLRRWRLRVDRDRILTFQGVPFYPLDAVPGIRIRFDEKRLALALEAPPEAFETFRLDVRGLRRIEPSLTPGAFLDYDLVATAGRGVEERVDALMETGIFGPFGVLRSGFVMRDLFERFAVERLETTLVRDFPDRRTTLRLGDALTRGGSFTGAERFAGVLYGTDFSLDPTFVAFPLPAIGGLARQRSVVEVLVDNVRQATGEVPPGPFEITNIPVVTGAGEVQLKVRDLLGRERLVTQRYYLSPRLLRPGLADWSLSAGLLRRRYGEASFDYGDPFVSGVLRYGLGESLTGEVHGAWRRGRALGIVGGSLRLGRYGLLSGAVGVSHDADEGTGFLLDLSYEYLSGPFDITLGTRYAGSGFRELGDGRPPRRRDEARLGFDLGRAGRLGLQLVRREPAVGDTVVAATASWSLPLGRGSLLVDAARLFEPRSDFAVGISWSLPLGGDRTVSAETRLADGERRLRARVRGHRGATDLGLDWRLAAEVGDRPRRFDARAAYRGRYGRVGGELEVADGDPRVRLSVDGSLAYVGGRLHLTRRVGRAFGLVALPGLPGVRVYLDNREVGRTDADGLLLIPGLRPYEANRISLELDDLPLGVSVARPVVEVAPYRGAAVVVDFGLDTDREATARLVADGRPLPAGLVLRARAGRALALVGRDGFAHLRGLGEGPVVLEGDRDGRRWRCPVPPPPADDPLPDLGEIPCRHDTAG